jgi:hypothetical protein
MRTHGCRGRPIWEGKRPYDVDGMSAIAPIATDFAVLGHRTNGGQKRRIVEGNARSYELSGSI